MLKEKVYEEILKNVAPCSMFCSTCTGCQYGKISYHAQELLHLLEGHEEFLDINLTSKYRHKLDEFKLFEKKLKKYAYPRCSGCRNERANGCSIKGCFIPECTKEHNVDFCAECSEFPCDKVNKTVFKETTINKWKEGNQQIKEFGITEYYEKNKNRPHYINYVKKKGKVADETKN